MILSQEEKEYFQLFNDMIVALYVDSTVEPLKAICRQCIAKEAEIFQVCQSTWRRCVKGIMIFKMLSI